MTSKLLEAIGPGLAVSRAIFASMDWQIGRECGQNMVTERRHFEIGSAC
jgi:hypothetical protein